VAQIVSPAQTSFNAGELSPRWAGRVDMAKYGNGCYRMRNFTPWPEGPANRRNGTRYAANTKDVADRSWLARFVFSEDDSYVLEFGDGYVRFYANGGQVLLSATPAAYNGATAYVVGDLVSSAGVNYYCKANTTGNAPPNTTYWHALTGDIYEIPSPYSIGELTNADDGTFRLDMEQVGDVVFIAHNSYFPRKLARFSATRWTFTEAAITNGPFEDVNPDSTVTVYASAATGAVTLTASAAGTFTTADIGTLFLLEQKKADAYAVWEVAKAVALNAERRSDSNVYRALNAATTGSVKPTHREGSKFDGDTGVNWQYVHSGYGFALITAIGGGGTTATATVVSELPSQVVGVANATTKWAHAAWRSDVGFPSLVKVHRDRLNFLRGFKLWGSVAGSYEDFAARDGAETLPDSAYSIEIGSNDDAVWAASQDALLVGTRGAEFSVREVTNSDVFGPGNIKATSRTKYGSRQVPPLTIGDSTLMVQRSGKRVRDMRIDPNSLDGGYMASDLMVLSSHIARGAIVQWGFALEPNSIAWACCADGTLIACTYLLEQDVLAWHPHPLGGTDVAVESVVTIPAPDGDYDQVWFQVRRTINGATVRTIEYLDREWDEDTHALEDALFSDCALTFDGAFAGSATLTGGTTWAAGDTGSLALGFVPAAGDVGDYIVMTASNGDTARVRIDTAANPAAVTFITAIPASLQGLVCNDLAWARDTLTGLDHLEGEEVTLTVEGAAFPPQTVTGGAISLGQTRGRKAQIGLRADAELVTMRIEGGSGNGTSQGKIKRVQRCIFRLHQTLGGSAGPEDGEQAFQFRTPNMAMDQAPDPFTGDYEQPYDEGYSTDARVRFVCDQPLPATVVAMYPRLSVEDRT
jgi:hypothetical protein